MVVLGFAVILLTGLIVAVAISTWWTIQRLRRPPRRTYATAVARGQPADPTELQPPREYESWPLSCRVHGRPFELPVWDIVGDDPTGPVIVCTPGWSDSKIGVLQRMDALAPEYSRVLAWDPPSHGEAPGFSELGAHEHDALGALLDAMSDEAHERGVVLFGWSLGGGVAIVTAAKRADDSRIIGVIAEAPYRVPKTPAKNVVRLAGMPWIPNGPLAFALLGWALGVGPKWRGFDRAEHAGRLACPLLVIHGTNDAVSPVEDGRAIAKSASHGAFISIEGADHNDLWTDKRFKPQCVRAAVDFIRSARLRSGTSADPVEREIQG